MTAVRCVGGVTLLFAALLFADAASGGPRQEGIVLQAMDSAHVALVHLGAYRGAREGHGENGGIWGRGGA